jgi:hypothetical protein
MARGFESKSVSSQQESAFGEIDRERATVDAEKQERRRRLELTRADLSRQLESAPAGSRREALESALAALDRELKALGD